MYCKTSKSTCPTGKQLNSNNNMTLARNMKLGPHVQGCVRTKKWCMLFFTSTISCIKSEMNVEMCGASRQLQGWRTHFSTAVDSLETLRGDVGKLL